MSDEKHQPVNESFKESAETDSDAMSHRTTKQLDAAGEHIEPDMRTALNDLDDMLDDAEKGYEIDASRKPVLLDRLLDHVIDFIAA